jgi:hypothetical protein
MADDNNTDEPENLIYLRRTDRRLDHVAIKLDEVVTRLDRCVAEAHRNRLTRLPVCRICFKLKS